MKARSRSSKGGVRTLNRLAITVVVVAIWLNAGNCVASDNCGTTKFGLLFHNEVRLCYIVDGVSEVPEAMRTVREGVVVDPNSVTIWPNVSFFTKGLGLRTGSSIEGGQWRIGVRPEVVLSPHNLSQEGTFNWAEEENTVPIGNTGYSAYWGSQINDWVVPEYIVEFEKGQWTYGASYKVYHMTITNGIEDPDGNPTMYHKFGLPSLNCLSVYGRYDRWTFGFTFFLNETGGNGQPKLDVGVPILVGYSF